jgi:hypothetical protein
VSERPPDEPLEPEFDPGLPRRRSEHGGMPRRDDDEFALAAERDRVAAGLEDYAPDDVPPAADPPPPEVSEAVDLRNEGCWATPQSTRRTADSAVLRVRPLLWKRTPPRAGWRRLLSHSSAWLSVECVSTERAVVAFATVRLAADLAADHLLWRPSLDGEQRSG